MIKNGRKAIVLGTAICLIVFAVFFAAQASAKNFNSARSVDINSKDFAVDLNKATQEDLDEIPGIGSALARQIVAYREKYGDYVDIDELLDIQGMSSELYEQITQYIYLGGS